ncbi:hypothetical protein CWI80_08675 [Pseudidiomarina sediminum]|uniref:Uncharacterized protein n=1 Tax=Pseudidiomarina sediminum TaxID=431675 RepID=A0A432Z407_9GAMM|nr:hypothetical protein [Pseudidiomarina sediminum]MBY6062811.1 hypothetical protein [Pseudidiomarina sediminum]RUO72611.1 hypothetical protein CWI80_08675 [Pseudidiomarina sediminum]
MIYALILIVIGFAVVLSGVWEQNLVTIVLGLFIEIVGWVGFWITWRAAKKQGNMHNNDKN